MDKRYRLHPFMVFLLVFLPFTFTHSQGIAIGEWRDHLPYHDGIDVATTGDRIYCANYNGLFYLEINDNFQEVFRLTKVQGLSDLGIVEIEYSEETKALIIAYENTNIDLIIDKKIRNLPDIKNKVMQGKKTINNVLVDGEKAYLSCGFGIVVVDLTQAEIFDTYYIGNNASQIEVFDLAIAMDTIYAVTEQGIYRASKSAANLAYYGNWSIADYLPENFNEIRKIASFDNKLFMVRPHDPELPDSILVDSVFYFDGVNLNFFWYENMFVVKGINTDTNFLYISSPYRVHVINTNLETEKAIERWDGRLNPSHAIKDAYDNYWISDRDSGLIRSWNEDRWTRFIHPNGPFGTSVYSMESFQGHIWVMPGGVTSVWSPSFNTSGIYTFIDEEWDSFENYWENGYKDLLNAAIDPWDPEHVFVSSYRMGIIEYRNKQIVKIYKEPEYPIRDCSDMVFDENGNLWILDRPDFGYLTPEGEYIEYEGILEDLFDDHVIGLNEILIDDYNQKWMLSSRENAIFVFKNQNAYKKLTSVEGNGNIPGSEILSMEKDRDGYIWIGTNEGVAVFYNAIDILENGVNIDAQQIKVVQDGYVQYLLETEAVTCIAIDGANRKWFGTRNSGVYLMSSDGTEQILHFTNQNSPLFSNEIEDIAINGESGEVFFGTTQGIISYRSTSTQGSEEHTEVKVFPNPVKKDYDGVIAIKGLVTDANVKIVDISGNLVFSTKALGGQAIWDGKNFNNEKVNTGIYMVFSTNEDGTETIVTKILML